MANETSSRPSFDHLVIDSSALIHQGPIRETGKNIYCCQEIVDEIKDKATRERLRVLPYEIKMVRPDHDALVAVMDFAKRTGDYNQLSAVDLKLIAVCYQLERRFNGEKYVNKQPKDVCVKPMVRNPVSALPKPTSAEVQNGNKMDVDCSEDDSDQYTTDEDDGSVEDYESDDEGWITPENIDEVRKKMGAARTEEIKLEPGQEDRIRVACMTSDFSIQNCMIQMGLLVVSPKDGLMIREAHKIALRCHACYKVQYDLTKVKNDFCPHCGNLDTLKRVNYAIDKDGNKKVFINFKRPIKVKNNNKSLPLPRGGKHSTDPILAPDQRTPKERDPKMAIVERKTVSAQNVLTDPAYVTRTNPFAQHVIREVNRIKERARSNRRKR